jgi:hypothetical protein
MDFPEAKRTRLTLREVVASKASEGCKCPFDESWTYEEMVELAGGCTSSQWKIDAAKERLGRSLTWHEALRIPPGWVCPVLVRARRVMAREARSRRRIENLLRQKEGDEPMATATRSKPSAKRNGKSKKTATRTRGSNADPASIKIAERIRAFMPKGVKARVRPGQYERLAKVVKPTQVKIEKPRLSAIGSGVDRPTADEREELNRIAEKLDFPKFFWGVKAGAMLAVLTGADKVKPKIVERDSKAKPAAKSKKNGRGATKKAPTRKATSKKASTKRASTKKNGKAKNGRSKQGPAALAKKFK